MMEYNDGERERHAEGNYRQFLQLDDSRNRHGMQCDFKWMTKLALLNLILN